MTLFSKLLAFVFIFMLASCVLYVAFGQLTVRKLRKNPKTKGALGLEFVSGWDIVNVAQALALPCTWSKKLEESKFLIYANSEVLLEHTTRADRILGASFYWTMTISGLTGILLIVLNYFGVFPE